MSGIVWLASYPKSGNTWMRVFLSNLLVNGESPVNINALRVNRLSQDRSVFDEISGIDSIDLTSEEIDYLRPEVYRYLAVNSKEKLFIKCHDAYTFLPNGRPIFPPEISKAIYIVRNPLDVAVSYSFHIEESIDNIITYMNDENYFIGVSAGKGAPVLNQRLLTWSKNVESWVDATNIEVHVVRYEDMKAKPAETFTEIARFAGLQSDEAGIFRAIQFSDFRLLKSQEQQHGFGEMKLGQRSFFREGRSGGWREYLNDIQVERIIQDHRYMMQRFGYLDAAGNVLDQK
jgi:hypothetical protein